MSAANCPACGCPTPETVQVPGLDGQSSFTTVLAPGFVVPALGAQITIPLTNSNWMAEGNGYFVFGGGYFRLDTIFSPTSGLFTYLNITANTASGNTIPAGATVVAGSIGADGTDGINVTTLTTAGFTIPAVNANVSVPDGFIHGASTAALAVGLTVLVSDGVDFGNFEVISIPNSTTFVAQFKGHTGDGAPGAVIDSGATVTPSGTQPPLAGALPTALTDNSTGTPGATIAVGVGEFTHSVFFRAAAITGNVLLYTYTPGFAFKIVRISASVVDAITTVAKAATLTTAIAATPTTGGIVVMAGAYALGAQQASSAAITALNTGTAAQAITVTASAVTAFVEGGFMLHMEIQNSDSANAIASLNTSINTLITALT